MSGIIRIKDLDTAEELTSGDYIAVDSAGEGLRKVPLKPITDDISDLKSAIEEIEPLSDDTKVALLNCFQHVAWVDEHGQDYYDALESALYGVQYPKITAVFNPGSNVIYTDDTLDSLKQYLTVKYFETEESAGTVIASANYSLSGTLTEGASTVFVSYSGLTTSFVIDDVVDFYNILEWNYPGNLVKVQGGSISFGSSPNYTPGIAKPNSTSVSRNTVSVERGLSDMDSLHWDGGGGTDIGPSGYYLIPIPVNCNNVTFECDPSSYYASVRIWHYNGNNNWTRHYETGWKTGSFTWDFSENLTDGDTGYYASVNIKFNSSGSAGADVSGFSMTFGRSND